jgi:Flp pilus assembly protein TadD
MLALAALFAAQAAAANAPPDPADRYRQCVAQAASAPDGAQQAARQWRAEGGGMPARHCLALALLNGGKPADAHAELRAAAAEAEAARNPLAAPLWGQAGNAALVAGRASDARSDLNTALRVGAGASAAERAGWLTDRARAAVAAGDLNEARADLDSAVALAPADAQALMFSAALAAREGDGPRARREITDARRLAPTDPAVAAEAKRIGVAALDSPPARASEPVVPLAHRPR